MLPSGSDSSKFTRYLSADVGSFREALHEYLRDDIIKIIRTDGTWTVGSILHQDAAKSMVNGVMWWLFNDEPEKALAELEQLNSPQHICGRVFKPGEPTYSCRECAMDPTCVFCQQCFWNSEHKKHRYRMHTSAGGGCCDCGDVEAWHQHPACSNHKHDAQSYDSKDSVSRLPSSLRERAPYFFEAILHYIIDLLTNERTNLSQLDDSLQPSEKVDSYITMLFNDELHTFDFVIDVLKRALKCNDAIGSDFATIVDREGRSAVCIDTEAKCEDVKRIVGSPPSPFFSFRTNKPLKTLVIHTNIVAHQEMALLILPILTRVVKQSDGLRVLFCEAMMKEMFVPLPSGSGRMSATEILIRSDHTLWKSAHNQYLQLLMNSFLLDVETKKRFAILFTRLYGTMLTGFIGGDHEHMQSVTSLAVQLYTVPTVARYLIVHEDVICIILQAITKSCFGTPHLDAREWCKIMNIDKRKLRTTFRRVYYAFNDLRYILAILPDQWNPELKSSLMQGVKLFLQILLSMQGMDSFVRKTDRHIEHEPDWESGTSMMMRFYPIVQHLLPWIATHTDLMFSTLRLCFEAFAVLVNNPADNMKPGVTKYNGVKYQCIDYDITKQPVSSQYPLSRFMAAVFIQLAKTGAKWSDIMQKVGKRADDTMVAVQLMEYPMRCLSLSAQVNAGMWRRNGLSLVNQLIFYKDYRCKQEAFERDIQMLQVCASNMDPNHFIALLLHKMKCDEFDEFRMSLFDEFLRILIYVCGERFVEGVADITVEEQIRRQIIHILAIEPKPHSKIVKNLPDSVTDKAAWEDTLQQVADFQEPTSINNVGRYTLKSSCLDEFCPYSYHYALLTDETKARQEVSRRKKSMQMSPVFIPPKLPSFSPLLQNVPDLLSCDVFVHVISTFLQQLTSGNPEQLMDRLVDEAFYLISMALVENERKLEQDPNTSYNFAKKATTGCESSILFLLKQLQVIESLAIHRDTIRWLVNKIEQLTNRNQEGSSVDPAGSIEEETRENDSTRNARKRKAQELRDKLLTQMKVMQQTFLSKNPDLVSEQSMESNSELSQEVAMSQDQVSPVCMDLEWQLQACREPEPSYTCMLCQEEATASSGSIVMSALVQRSTVLTRGPREELNEDNYAQLFMDLSFPNGIHVSTCSHAMHYECFKQFRESVNSSESRRRHHRFTRRSFDVTAKEFLCPLCSRLSNTIVPVLSREVVSEQQRLVTKQEETTSTMKEWLRSVEELLKPVKHEAQEVVLKFHADVTELNEEMESAETESSYAMASSLEDTVNELVKSPVAASSDARAEEAVVLQKGLTEALDEFLQTIQFTGLNGKISELHRPLTSWLSVSTTVICAEMISHLNQTAVLQKNPVRVSAALDGVVRSAYAMQATYTEEFLSTIRKYAMELLSALTGETAVGRKSLMNCNMFCIFVNLWFSTTVLRCSKLLKEHKELTDDRQFEKNLLHLCTLAQVVQIFVRLDVESLPHDEPSVHEDLSQSESSEIYQACNQIRSSLGLPLISSSISGQQILSTVQKCLLPFVRCCALFLYHVTGVPGPDSHAHEMMNLLSYLGLPKDLSELFDVGGTLSLEPLIQRWLADADIVSVASRIPRHLSFPVVSDVPNIVPFPHDYSELIGSAASFRCPKFASEDSLYPTMCLVCGVMLCSQSYCCQQPHPETNRQVGACTFHAHSCGAGTGMFLRVREATIVLLSGVHSGPRGCFIHAPYLDRHGETDKGMRRGNPLYLNQGRYLELRKLWLSHSIAEKISHDIESLTMGHVLDWAHL